MARPPHRFEDFIGQQEIVEYLRRLGNGAKARGIPLPHILFCGPPGSGKSAIAKTIARQTGRTFHKLSAFHRLPPQELVRILQGVRVGDILFVDEAHALAPALQLILCGAMEDGLLPVVAVNSRRLPRVTAEETPIPAFSVFLATDQPDLLSPALRSRIGATVEIRPYNAAEMRGIVELLCEKEDLSVTRHAISFLAEASHQVPREARNLVRLMRIFYATRNDMLQRADVLAFLKGSGMDEKLLGEQARIYLLGLLGVEGPARPEALAARLGRRQRWMKETEFFLLRKGLIDFRPEGRTLTVEGRREALRIRSEKANEEQDDNAIETPDESGRTDKGR